jgi:hypothetical protein
MPGARRVRAVADTNTIVSALLWHGSPHQLIVSGGAHLLNLKSIHRMPIVTTTEALARRQGNAHPWIALYSRRLHVMQNP